MQDTKCDASSFDQYDFMVKSLAGYGLAGKITMQVPFRCRARRHLPKKA